MLLNLNDPHPQSNTMNMFVLSLTTFSNSGGSHTAVQLQLKLLKHRDVCANSGGALPPSLAPSRIYHLRELVFFYDSDSFLPRTSTNNSYVIKLAHLLFFNEHVDRVSVRAAAAWTGGKAPSNNTHRSVTQRETLCTSFFFLDDAARGCARASEGARPGKKEEETLTCSFR